MKLEAQDIGHDAQAKPEISGRLEIKKITLEAEPEGVGQKLIEAPQGRLPPGEVQKGGKGEQDGQQNQQPAPWFAYPAPLDPQQPDPHDQDDKGQREVMGEGASGRQRQEKKPPAVRF